MFEEGDIVSYIGNEKASIAGNKLKFSYIAFDYPPCIGIICYARLMDAELNKTERKIMKYYTRICMNLSGPVHEIMMFYDFELVKIN